MKLNSVAILLLAAISANGQVLISDGSTNVDNSAILELKSNNKGFLLPRITAGEMLAIPSPATGLMVFVTGADTLIYINRGKPAQPKWQSINSEWQMSGNTLYPKSINANVGIGTSSPANKMEVMGSFSASVGNQKLSNDSVEFLGEKYKFSGAIQSNNDTIILAGIVKQGNSCVNINGYIPNGTPPIGLMTRTDGVVELRSDNILGIGSASELKIWGNEKILIQNDNKIEIEGGGNMYFKNSNVDNSGGIILRSQNGQCWWLYVNNGASSAPVMAKPISCP